MEGSDISATSPSSSSSPPPPPQSAVVLSPCAACKILRRRCVEKCVLAPYFPPHDPLKFTTAHRVFGASNIIKFLQVRTQTHTESKNIIIDLDFKRFGFFMVYSKKFCTLFMYIDKGNTSLFLLVV